MKIVIDVSEASQYSLTPYSVLEHCILNIGKRNRKNIMSSSMEWRMPVIMQQGNCMRILLTDVRT